MTTPRVFPSTTSHKAERLAPSLEVFARLGFTDIDLNLNHIIDGHASAADALAAIHDNGQRVRIVSGGWCDFFDEGRAALDTRRSVEQQVDLVHTFGAPALRLFFGRLPISACSPSAIDVCARNIRHVAACHPDILFAFENHDGASASPAVCRTIIEAADTPNARLVFDPINFVHRGETALEALATLLPHIAHVHLKGYARGSFCGFDEGEVDLLPVIRLLCAERYAGAFTVEYEGAGDRTVRLFTSVRRAQAALEQAEKSVSAS